MGCRKDAHRALVELPEWMEDERSKAAKAARALQAQQACLWTPKSLCAACRLQQWIAHGPKTRMGRVSAVAALQSKGRSGACGKHHAQLVLEWKDGAIVAAASHAMDPLLKCLNNLVQQELAVKLQQQEDNNGTESSPE